jgi:hypothetical protein
MSYQEFRRHWDSPAFSELMERAVDALHPSRHARNLSLQVGANIRIMESRGSDEPYDGIIEWWWESAAQLAPLLDTTRAQEAIREITAFQAQFVDFGSSPSFFTEA